MNSKSKEVMETQIVTVTQSKTIKFRGPYTLLEKMTAREFIESIIGNKLPEDTEQIRLSLRLNFHKDTETLPHSTR